MVLNGVFRMGRGVNGVRTYGMQSESFAFFYFFVSLYGNTVTKLCSFGRLGRFGRADAVRVGVSQPLIRKKRQQISTNFK